MTTDDELLELLTTALDPEPREPPAQLISALRDAATADLAAQRKVEFADASTVRRSRMRRSAPFVAVAATAAAFLLGGALQNQIDSKRNLLADGVVEFRTVLSIPGRKSTAAVTGIRTGIGRVVQLRTDALPILPKGQFYELWFVGPGDIPGSPNRISAGTFHPDEDGRSDVDLTAAVNPALYPRIGITAEPKDGDPSPRGPDVLQGAITIQNR